MADDQGPTDGNGATDEGAEMSFEEWQKVDEEWQARAAAGEDPGPRTPPPLPPAPDPEALAAEGEQPVAESKSAKWWRRGEDAAVCASCGCALSDICDLNLRVLHVALLGTVAAGGSAPSVLPEEFDDAAELRWSTRRSLSTLRWYKRRVSARTPNVCTQQVSCSAFAARTVRELGVPKAAPLVVRRLRLCAATARAARQGTPGTLGRTSVA